MNQLKKSKTKDFWKEAPQFSLFHFWHSVILNEQLAYLPQVFLMKLIFNSLIFICKMKLSDDALTHVFPVIHCYAPWKHQKTFMFSDVFRGCGGVTLGWNGLVISTIAAMNMKVIEPTLVGFLVLLLVLRFIFMNFSFKCSLFRFIFFFYCGVIFTIKVFPRKDMIISLFAHIT